MDRSRASESSAREQRAIRKSHAPLRRSSGGLPVKRQVVNLLYPQSVAADQTNSSPLRVGSSVANRDTT
jgi:hypothetical protein